jgi:hypothetical protein
LKGCNNASYRFPVSLNASIHRCNPELMGRFFIWKRAELRKAGPDKALWEETFGAIACAIGGQPRLLVELLLLKSVPMVANFSIGLPVPALAADVAQARLEVVHRRHPYSSLTRIACRRRLVKGDST